MQETLPMVGRISAAVRGYPSGFFRLTSTPTVLFRGGAPLRH